MAGQNIVIAGATFNAVPSIVVPTSGGGSASFVDTSDASATASDIASGKTAYVNGELVTGTGSGGSSVTVEALSVTANGTYTAPTGTAYSPVTVNVSGGGGGDVAPNDVNFIDYDGTIVYSYSAADFANLTELPANPSHTGLTAQGWNWTLAQIQAQLTAMPGVPVWVGQMYITDDGKTRLYCHFEEGRLAPYLGLGVNGTVEVDWGDGSNTNVLTGTSLTTVKTVRHNFASAGDYCITLTVLSGSASIFGTSTSAHILKKAASASASADLVYSNALQRVELGASVSIGNYAFRACYSLASITIPSGVTSIGTYAFLNCYSLSSITIPSGVTSIGNYAFNSCSSLSSITIPSGVTRLGSYAFQYCYSLSSITIPSGVTSLGNYAFSSCSSLSSITIPSEVTSIGTYAFNSCSRLSSITIPSGVTSIGNYAFLYCYSLASITIPSEVTSIGTYAFNSCYGLAAIHFLPTTPPTVSSSNAWSSLPSDCIIYVPAGTLADYTSASYYPDSSTYTYVEE